MKHKAPKGAPKAPLFLKKEAKKAATFRLCEEVLELISKASNDNGVSKADIIEGCVKHVLCNKES